MESFLFSGVFWGGILVLWGISIIINTMFHVNIPIFRIILAFIFVYIGFKMLWGGYKFGSKVERNTVIFSDTRMKFNPSDENNEYNVIFGKSELDLTGISVANKSERIRVNVIFGEGIVEVNPDTPLKVDASAVFAGAFTPDETVTSFGHHIYRSPSYKKDENSLEIEANCVFGGVRILNRK